MHKYFSFVLVIVLLALSCNNEQSQNNKNQELESVFSFVQRNDTGIKFNNQLTPEMNTLENLFDFDYFYNGAGVGVGDINNDGLDDIFFCGNQVDNKLYLNKGNFEFEDISTTAGINIGKQWSNGVTFADVNNDGFIDIYVSQGGPKKDIERRNLLFINNQDLTFTERAMEYRLGDQGISTQSSFADFDDDGDLDCIVMNEAELFGYDLIPFYEKVNFNKETKWYNTSHIYENINGKFIDRTEGSALDNPSFGLGLVIADINNDNKPDIYIANDYYVPDAMYINKGDFQFSDEIKNRTNQISFYGMGLDIADINNDTYDDIFVLDMAAKDHYRAKTLMASMNVSFFDLLTNKIGFAYQYMYNSLQLADGTGSYNNISQLSGLSSTDWSWTALMEDFNNDGYRDIYVTNGYRKYALDNDFKSKIRNAKEKHNGRIPIDVKSRLYKEIPEEKLSNIIFRNNGDLTFDNATNNSGLNIPSYSNGAAVADFDNDGDLDIVVNNIDGEAMLFDNKSKGNWLQVKTKTNSESFTEVIIKYNGKIQSHEIKRTRGYMSSSSPIAHFGIGASNTIDEIIIKWKDGSIQKLNNITANQRLIIEKKTENIAISQSSKEQLFTKTSAGKYKISFKHNEDKFDDFAKETLLPHKQSTDGPVIKVVDINRDGKDDIFMSGASNQQSKIFIQENGKFNRLSLNKNNARFEDSDFSNFSSDNTSFLITSGGNSYGDKSQYPVRSFTYNNEVFSEAIIENNDMYGIASKVVSEDFDKDGDMDVIVAKRIQPQNYPIAEPSIYFENNNGTLTNNTASIIPQLGTIGIINDIEVTDINNDGWMDIIAVGEWTGIHILMNNQGKFSSISEHLIDKKGWWYSIQSTDINNDGLKDYIIGNLGLNSKYKASTDKPLKVFAEDFDKNGSLDIVLSKKYKDEFVPFRGKECSSQQMPFINEKFPTYDLFAKASIEDVYGDLDNTYYKSANTFESVLIKNKGNGDFELQTLPILAQALPIKDMISTDLNNDGYEDIIAVGNIYNSEVETPRMDYNGAIILINNNDNGYNAQESQSVGMKINGNAKSIEKLKIDNKEFVIIGVNDGLLNMFEIRKKSNQ